HRNKTKEISSHGIAVNVKEVPDTNHRTVNPRAKRWSVSDGDSVHFVYFQQIHSPPWVSLTISVGPGG
ncbi:hypothetical protein M9458_016987, partial [Cirrhinus mrigala]